MLVRVVLQRVTRASVAVDGETIGAIKCGLLLLVGVAEGDAEDDARRLAQKCAEMRIFPDQAGRFNRSLLDAGGEALVVSQFTLLADTRRGRRPSFIAAAPPELAERLYQVFVDAARELQLVVATGRFRADMAVSLVNDGPVTILLDSRKLF